MSKEGVKQTQEYRKPRKRVKLEERNGAIGKVCTGECNEWKPLVEYKKHTQCLGGVNSVCKKCMSKREKEYYKKNREIKLAKQKQYREYHKTEISLRIKRWKNENKERVTEQNRQWYQSNKEYALEKRKMWYLDNKEIHLTKNKERYEINKKRILAKNKEWSTTNKEKVTLIGHRRRARKNQLPDNITYSQKNKIAEHFGGCCALTGNNVEVHWDHAIPLATGHGGTIFGNMVPLRSDLNISKNDSNIFEWFEANRQRFELSQERFDNLIAWLASANAMTVGEYREYVYWCHANPRSIDELEAQ